MSRKNKTLRAFLHQNPNPTTQEIWNAAWKAQGNKAYSLKIQQLEATIERIEALPRYDMEGNEVGVSMEYRDNGQYVRFDELQQALEQQE